MGLFRLAAVAAIGISLLPSDKEQQEMLYNRAAHAAEWTMTFCGRNAKTCDQASNFWGEFVKKAEFGGKLAYDMFRDQGEAQFETGALPASPRIDGTHTLTAGDFAPAWRGKPKR